MSSYTVTALFLLFVECTTIVMTIYLYFINRTDISKLVRATGWIIVSISFLMLLFMDSNIVGKYVILVIIFWVCFVVLAILFLMGLFKNNMVYWSTFGVNIAAEFVMFVLLFTYESKVEPISPSSVSGSMPGGASRLPLQPDGASRLPKKPDASSTPPKPIRQSGRGSLLDQPDGGRESKDRDRDEDNDQDKDKDRQPDSGPQSSSKVTPAGLGDLDRIVDEEDETQPDAKQDSKSVSPAPPHPGWPFEQESSSSSESSLQKGKQRISGDDYPPIVFPSDIYKVEVTLFISEYENNPVYVNSNIQPNTPVSEVVNMAIDYYNKANYEIGKLRTTFTNQQNFWLSEPTISIHDIYEDFVAKQRERYTKYPQSQLLEPPNEDNKRFLKLRAELKGLKSYNVTIFCNIDNQKVDKHSIELPGWAFVAKEVRKYIAQTYDTNTFHLNSLLW